MKTRSREWATPEQPKQLLRAFLVGLLGGGTALLFRKAAETLPTLVWRGGTDMVRAVESAPPVLQMTIPVVGALLAGLVLSFGERWSGRTRGWDILEAVVLRDGVLHLKPTLVKALSSLLTVASAGPVGREGPIVLASATVSSVAGQWMRVSTRDLRVMAGCGIAAGFACAYNTPISAALFAMEVIFGTFALEVFAPLVIASVVATLLTWATFGNAPVFAVPPVAMVGPWEVVPYAGLGLLGGLFAAGFLVALRLAARFYKRSGLPRPLAMASAALVLGLVVQRFPEVVGNGREAIGGLFLEQFGLGHAVVLLLLRLLVTPLAVGSGSVGGVFTPTLFLGAMLGDAFGQLVGMASPWPVADARAYALVGMGCLLAGTTHAPMMSVLMVFEMTLHYELVVPLLLASAISSLLASGLTGESVYTEALRRKAASEDGAVLGTLTVRDVMRDEQVTIAADLTLQQVLDAFVASRRNHLYVVGPQGEFRGAVNLHDANRELLRAAEPWNIRATDLLRARFEATVPEERLDRVLERFFSQGSERLPVLEDLTSRKLLGTVSRRDILSLYSLELLQRTGVRAESVEAPVDRLVEEIPVPAELAGLPLGEARFRDRYGVSVLMVRRGSAGWVIPDDATVLAAADRLIVFGPQDRLQQLSGAAE